LILLAALATVALSCWYTFLFFMLTRARNEFEAALGGLLLTIAAHVWLGQVNYPGLRVPLGLNPFAMFLVLIYPQPPYFAWLPLTLMIVVQLVVWIGLPVLVIGWQTRRRANV